MQRRVLLHDAEGLADKGQRSDDGKPTWLYGEELSGTDIVSFNLYRLAGPRLILKPCELSSAKVIEFVLGFEPSMEKAAPRP
ncbi:hypothetical protein [Rhizobium laguerreae]|uniref:hypothetical protein n=1 Tax=Rhizobium laguerreae TaxID=1076926 RepID=UPI0028A6B487|nr:hypothetical protein [Rhizobium laguerreae]